jgi:D-alanine-D-alanine ligase
MRGAPLPENESVEETVRAAGEALRAEGLEPRPVSVEGPPARLIEFALESKRRGWTILNLCETVRGESAHESRIASILELCGATFTGSGSLALALAQDKARARAILAGEGLPVAPGFVARRGVGLPRTLGFPLLVKPSREDGSVGIHRSSVVQVGAALEAAVARVHERFRQAAIVERFLPGREFGVSLVGNEGPVPLPPSEIDFSRMPRGAPRVVTYEGKWRPGHADAIGTEPRCPARVDRPTLARLARLACAAFEALGLRGYGRIDLREDGDGKLHVLDVNPNPDLSPTAGFARAARAAGTEYPALLGTLLALAREPWERRAVEARTREVLGIAS